MEKQHRFFYPYISPLRLFLIRPVFALFVLSRPIVEQVPTELYAPGNKTITRIDKEIDAMSLYAEKYLLVGGYLWIGSMNRR